MGRVRVIIGLVIPVILLGGMVGLTNNATAAAVSDKARIAFGLPELLTGEAVENQYGLPLNASELARLKAADQAIAKGKALAAVIGSRPDEWGGSEYDRINDRFILYLVDPSTTTMVVANSADLGVPVVVKQVPHTVTELNQTADDVLTFVKSRRLSATVIAPDWTTSSVLVELRDLGDAPAIAARFGDVVSFAEGGPVSRDACTQRSKCGPPYKAGLTIRRGSAYNDAECTAGFVYNNAVSDSGASWGSVWTTAGHCGMDYNGGAWYHPFTSGSTGGTSAGQQYDNRNRTDSNADVLFINIAEANDSNDVFKKWDSHFGVPQIQNMTARDCATEISGSSCESIGETSCYAGRTTGYRCTTLATVNVSAFSESGWWLHHQRRLAGNTSSGGDSGAPVFYLGTAKGHFWGGDASYMYYSHIVYVQEYCSWAGRTPACRLQIVD